MELNCSRRKDGEYIDWRQFRMNNQTERLYHLVAINDKTGKQMQLTAYPMPHEKCMIMKSKQSDATKALNRITVIEFNGA